MDKGSCHYDLMIALKTGGTETNPIDGRELPIYLVGEACHRARWSGKEPVPAIGDRIHINFNELGYGTVESYFVEHGWLGVKVRLERQPEWHRKQNGPECNYALVFGAELQ